MKLKTSFFNQTIFKKDITRFSPVWILYTIFGLWLGFGNVVYGYDPQGWFAQSIGASIGPLAIANCGYALVVALCLFGDLFKGRLCNAIHALPVRREELFVTHTAAGMLFSLVPNTVLSLLFMTAMGDQWVVALLWLLGMTVEYLFFFSLAAVCAVSTGSRFAMTAVYGLVNVFSIIVWWFINNFYAPLLPGLHLRMTGFDLFSPVVRLAADEDLVKFRVLEGYFTTYRFDGLSSGWWYLLALAVLSFGLLGLGIFLYRKRKLETAGDFVAFRPMVPVLSALFTLCVAAVFQAVGYEMSMGTLSLMVGLVVGCFGTEMLLRRTVKVFHTKTVLKCLAIGVAFGFSLLLTAIDPLGLTRWTPETQEVESLVLSTDYNYDPSDRYGYHRAGEMTVTDPEMIQQIVKIHECLTRDGMTEQDVRYYSRVRAVHLTYKMKNGSTAERRYYYDIDSDIARRLQVFWDMPEFLLGYSDWDAFLKTVNYINVSDNEDYREFTGADARELMEAIKADCLTGAIGDDVIYEKNSLWVEICTENHWVHLALNDHCVNTMKWLEENRFTVIE